MILNAILVLLQKLLDLLLSPIHIPSDIEWVGFNSVLDGFLGFFKDGWAIFCNWTYANIVLTGLRIIIICDIAYHAYLVVMWILRKFGVS